MNKIELLLLTLLVVGLAIVMSDCTNETAPAPGVEPLAQTITWQGPAGSEGLNVLRCLAYGYSANSTCNASRCVLHDWPFLGAYIIMSENDGGVWGEREGRLWLSSSNLDPFADVSWGGFGGTIGYEFAWGAHATCVITNLGGQQQSGEMVWQ